MIEIKKEKLEDYSFTIKTENGNTLLKSIVYSNKKRAEEAIQFLKTSKTNRNTFERKTSHDGEFLFSLKNNKGEIIGDSQLYQSEAGMENGIKNIIKRIDTISGLIQL
ncbi:MAG: DUF1508 domain-containing protein [Maribacter sp.]